MRTEILNKLYKIVNETIEECVSDNLYEEHLRDVWLDIEYKKEIIGYVEFSANIENYKAEITKINVITYDKFGNHLKNINEYLSNKDY